MNMILNIKKLKYRDSITVKYFRRNIYSFESRSVSISSEQVFDVETCVVIW
jgi:hypothetical protein